MDGEWRYEGRPLRHRGHPCQHGVNVQLPVRGHGRAEEGLPVRCQELLRLHRREGHEKGQKLQKQRQSQEKGQGEGTAFKGEEGVGRFVLQVKSYFASNS